MTRSALYLLALTALACTPADRAQRLDDELEVVDRAAALQGSVEGEAGEAPDLSAAPGGFFFDIDSSAMKGELDASGQGRRGGLPTYQAVTSAFAAVLVADVAAAAVVAPPAAAIAFAADGELTEVEPWLWTAENTAIGPDGESATLTLDVAWIGVGWLAEMRATTSDGTLDDTLWFDGFLSVHSAVGWWDLYQNDEPVGVIEWTADGTGNFQAGIAALAGEAQGDVLLFAGTSGEEHAVSYYDASADYTNYVLLHSDHSGEVALRDQNAGAPRCWGTDWADTPCEVK